MSGHAARHGEETQMPKREPLPPAGSIRHNPDASYILREAADDVNYAIRFVDALIDRVNILEVGLETLREGKQRA